MVLLYYLQPRACRYWQPVPIRTKSNPDAICPPRPHHEPCILTSASIACSLP